MSTKTVLQAATFTQPPPESSGEVVLDWVGDWAEPELFASLEARADMGVKKYGTFLRSHNGRWTLADAYQEALDLVMYLAQVDMEAGLQQPSALTAAAVELATAVAQDLKEDTHER